MRFRRTLYVLPWLLLCASVARAQTPTPAIPTTVDVLVLPPGSDPATAQAVATRTTPIGVAQNCGVVTRPGDPALPLINPTMVYFDDPFTAGRFCTAPLPTGLPPAANYIAIAIAKAPTCIVNNVTLTPCPSARSGVASPPFTIQSILTPPAALTNLVVRP